MLKKLHGNNTHVGKKLDNANNANDSIQQNQDAQITLDLRAKLKQCVKEEKYEEAAQIRDEIKKLENNEK